jgi:hypothetical protein
MTALPHRPKGRPTAASNACYAEQIKAFCARILEIQSRLDFEVGSRGWCYLLEGEHIVTKGEFNTAERLIVRCRKTGDLPLDICAEDDKRSADGVERLDDPDVEVKVDAIIGYVHNAHRYYTPVSFWDELDVYVEMATAWIANVKTCTGKSLADPKHPDHSKSYVQTYLKRFGARKVEANALVARPESGRELCRQAILRYVPGDALRNYNAHLAAARRELREAVARRLNGGRA